VPNSLPDATGYSGEPQEPAPIVVSFREMVSSLRAEIEQAWREIEDDVDAYIAKLQAGKSFRC
jgi:hypothetical protein